jgi:hypothetical protein
MDAFDALVFKLIAEHGEGAWEANNGRDEIARRLQAPPDDVVVSLNTLGRLNLIVVTPTVFGPFGQTTDESHSVRPPVLDRLQWQIVELRANLAASANVMRGFARCLERVVNIEAVGVKIFEPRPLRKARRNPALRGLDRNANAVVLANE